MRLRVLAEINGLRCEVGIIETVSGAGEQFTYSDEWIERQNSKPVSLSLPLEKRVFEAREIRPYFEGLLPEENARVAISRALHIPSTSYLKLLKALGGEFVGALAIVDDSDAAWQEVNTEYRLLSEDELSRISENGQVESARILTSSRLSIAGAQAKIGLYQSPGTADWYEPRGTASSTHIIKPSNPRFDTMAINECLCLATARKCGLSTPHAFMMQTAVPMLAIERYDRFFDDNPNLVNELPLPSRLHQEDFCQALGIPTEDKYEEGSRRYLSNIAGVIRDWSSDPIADLNNLWDILVFDYLVGNCDNHIKNISIIRSADWSTLRLAPFYDLVNTTLYEGLTREMGITIGSYRDIDKITRPDFEQLASAIDVSQKLMMKRLDGLRDRFSDCLTAAIEDLCDEGYSAAAEIGSAILADAGRRISAIR